MNRFSINRDSSKLESNLTSIILSKQPLSSESGIEEKLLSVLKGKFSLIGFYGCFDSVMCAVSEYFNEYPPVINEPSALSLILDKENSTGALVYICKDEAFTQKPLSPHAPICFYVNVLVRLCITVVPCFSTNILESWYYSEESTLKTPFSVNFREISKEVTQKHKYISGSSFVMPNEFTDLNKIVFSYSNAYYVFEINVEPNALAELKRANSLFVLKIFEENFDLEYLKSHFHTHIYLLKELINSPDENSNNIYERIHNAMCEAKSESSKSIVEMCENIINDTIDSKFVINQKTKGIIMKTSFSDGLEKFKLKVIAAKKRLVLEDLFTLYKKYIYYFIEVDDLVRKEVSRTIKKYWEISDKNINDSEAKARDTALKAVEQLEEFLIKKKIAISKFISIEDQEEKVFLKNEPDRTFVICFHKPIGEVKQVVELSQEFLLLVIEDSEKGFSEIFMISEDQSRQVLKIPSICLEIAKGSSLHKVIIVNNSRKQIDTYKIVNFALVKEKKAEFVVEHFVTFPCYVEFTEKLLFINENKELMCFDMTGESTRAAFYELNPFSINTSQGCQDFLKLSVSRSGKVIALLTRKSVVFLDFTTLTMIQPNVKASKIEKMSLFRAKKHFYLLFVKKNMIKAMQFVKVNVNSTLHNRKLIGNPIFDVFHYTIQKRISNSSIKCFQIAAFIKSSTSKDLIEKYYSNLSSTLKKIPKFSIISDFEEDLVRTKYSLNHFLQVLAQCLPSDLCHVYPFAPLSNSENKLSQIFALSPNPTVVEHLKNFLAFGLIEDYLKTMENVLVVGIIGPIFSNSIVLAGHLFNVQADFFTHTSMSIGISEIEGKNVIVFALEMLIKPLNTDFRKSLEFLTAICDLIILNISPEQKSGLQLLLAQVAYCKNRISDEFLYKAMLDITYFPVSKEYILSKSLENSFPLPMKCRHSAYTHEKSFTFLSEIQLVKGKYAEIPYRWTGPHLAFAIKSIISQLYVGDSHSLSYWKDPISNSIKKCKHRWVCDVEIKKNPAENDFLQVETCFNSEKCVKCEENRGCNEKCPWCSCFCDLEFGHFGFHSLKMHWEGCECLFFNETVYKVSQGEVALSDKDKPIDKWNKIGWDTPWQSINGLLPMEISNCISQETIKPEVKPKSTQMESCLIS